MIYQSNLRAPDLRPYFRLLDPPMQHCGYDAPSDPDFDPRCSYWTVDEAAILYNIAKSVPAGTWVDIGARLGWTAAHLAEAGHYIYGVDPELKNRAFFKRFYANTLPWESQLDSICVTSSRFFEKESSEIEDAYGGFVIDGNHDSPEPLNDAKGALAHAKPDCIIMFHDVLGTAVRDGVRFLMDEGWHCKLYWTPNGVACCWRGYEGEHAFVGHPLDEVVCSQCGDVESDIIHGFVPPQHVSDPKMDFTPHRALMTDMTGYWERLEK